MLLIYLNKLYLISCIDSVEGHNMKISIALATYNGEKYLSEQLNSFVSQELQPDELIICDDCSSDNTLSIARAFAASAPFFVHIFSNDKNLGYAKNFSQALENCTGDIVFLSDQDDVWFPSKIRKVVDRFNVDSDLQLFIHDLDYCKENLIPIGQTKIQRMEGVFDLERDYVVGMATAVRGSFLKLCLPIPDQVGLFHDNWLHECANAIGGKAIMRDVLAYYRRHPSNTTASGNLNVDFVTTPKHFKGGLLSNLSLFKQKTPLVCSELTPLTCWLQKQKGLLVSEGYSSAQRIDQQIIKSIKSNENIKERYRVLGLGRFKRAIPVCKLYLRGGYNQFCGWKSAFKDLFAN